MKHIFILILIFISSFGYGQETIDEMFDDGLVHDYRINPSIDVIKLIGGTSNINLELFLTESISITGGVGFTKAYKMSSFDELIDGEELIDFNVKSGNYLHMLAKYFYAERNQYRGYFGIGYNRHKINRKEFDIIYNSNFYKSKQIHFGGGVQWHGAKNITYDYYLGVGFTNKTTYADEIGIGIIETNNDLTAGFAFSFKLGYPIK